jgi:phosphoribosylformylglycinamidine synthase subunit PurL
VPLGVTDNLNFGNPFNPETFWQLRESVRGLAEGCRAFNAPVTGGNVSLYNQSPNGPIDPTPTVAMAGLIEQPAHLTTQWFKDEGDAIILLGELIDVSDPLQGLGGSAYLQRLHGLKTGTPPRCDLEKERDLDLALRALIHAGGIKSAHDCSEGGLAVALAESCISQQIGRGTPRLIGGQIELAPPKESGEPAASIPDQKQAAGNQGNPARLDAILFGETQGRIIVSTTALDAVKVVERAKLLGVSAIRLGTVGGDSLSIQTANGEFTVPVAEVHGLWWNAIAEAMR